MRADERQAAVAYAYAWWMIGDDDAAAAVLREAISSPDPHEDSDEARLAALMTAVRTALGDNRPMPEASELALLHDGFDVPIRTAAQLARVPADRAPAQLAHGRLEALLETVREDFRHPERLGGLAIGADDDVEHTAECRSCSRALALIERGRVELREVSPVSAPPGLIASLVAEFSPAVEAPAEAPPAVVEPEVPADIEAEVEAEAPAEIEAEAPAGADAPVLVGAPAGVDLRPAGDEVAVPGLEPAPVVEAEPLEEAPRPVEQEPALAPEAEPPARPRTAGVLAVAGVVTLSVLVVLFVASAGDDEQPAIDQTEEQPSAGGEPEGPGDGEAESEPPFGPDGQEREGFAVVDAGLLLSGEDEMTPSGTRIGRQETLRIAVDYENGSKGVQLDALWRVDEEVYQRLQAVVSAKASRHVWGVPVPEDGWPVGNHRIVITANDSVAGAIDFTVRGSN